MPPVEPPAEISALTARRRRLRPFIDFGAFFLFFGISGTDHGREARLRRRFEQEFYANVVTVTLGGPVAPGRYRLEGLPADANRRGWTVGHGGVAVSDLSDDGLAELRAWLARGNRRVVPTPLDPGA